MIDENAFGIFVSYATVENDEYALEREAFVERLRGFSRAVTEHATAHAPAEQYTGADLGHAMYFELRAGDEKVDLVRWLIDLYKHLTERGFDTVSALTHGGCWFIDPDGAAQSAELAPLPLLRISQSSEPLRHALALETAAVSDDVQGLGWGPGVYVETEAIEELGRKLKNAPTPLSIGGVTFYRIHR